MEEKEFNETRPCIEELKKLAIAMEKYGIQEYFKKKIFIDL